MAGGGVVDDFTREALATVVDVSLSGIRVARDLSRLIDQRGRPQDDRLRQQHGADQSRDPDMGEGGPHRMALHCTRKAYAECVCGIVQWPAAERMSQRAPVRPSQ